MKRYVRWAMGLLCLVMLGCVKSLFTSDAGVGTPNGQAAANGVPEVVTTAFLNTYYGGAHAHHAVYCDGSTLRVEDGHIVIECKNDTKRKHNLVLENYWSPPQEDPSWACGAEGAVQTDTGPITVVPGKTITVRIPIPRVPFSPVAYCGANAGD